MTPGSKEIDPNAVNLLLQTRRDGLLHLWFGSRFEDAIVNGKVPHGYTIDGQPDGLYWAWAVIPRWLEDPIVDVSAPLG